MVAVTPGRRVDLFKISERWLYDSGCGDDITTVEGDDDRIKECCTDVPEQIFNTANGEIKSDRAVRCTARIGDDTVNINAYVVPDTPSVLSMGIRCMEKDWRVVK